MATPLHYATVHGHTPVVERLLDKGADVGLTDANGETPLHDAATFGRVDEAGMLLAHEADVNALTPEEESPLDYAIDANAEEVVELLRTNGGKTGAELSIHTAAKRRSSGDPATSGRRRGCQSVGRFRGDAVRLRSQARDGGDGGFPPQTGRQNFYEAKKERKNLAD